MTRSINLEDTIYIDFTTRAFATGIPALLDGSPVLSVLEENNATPITDGVSVSVSRASVVGLNMATVVAEAGNGYELGKSYSLYISTGTVGGVSVVGEKVGEFVIGGWVCDVTAFAGNATSAINARQGFLGVIVDTCKSGSTATTIETNLTEASDNHYNNRLLTFVDGNLIGQSKTITDYNGTSKAFTVPAFTEAPADTDAFVIS